MIVIREYIVGSGVQHLWTAPDLTFTEALRTVAYWQRLGLACEVADIDPRNLGFNLENDE